jgi:hypothetical protein
VDASIAVKHAMPPRRRAVLGPEPAPAAVAPSGGRDGTAVTVSGSEFQAGARVYFGDTPADGVTVLSPSTIQCLAPDGPESRASARAAVSVANPDGQENGLANAFSYVGPPVLVAVAPAYSPEAGGLLHVLSGTGFRAGFSITVAGEAPAEATLVSGNQITFRGPAHAAGPVPVAVTDEFGRIGTLAGGITYVGPPTIVAATPPSVAFTGGRTIAVDGTNFRAGARAFLDGAELLPLTIVSPTRFRFTMPPGPAGEFDLAVRDEFGQETTAPDFLHRRGPFADRSTTAVPSPPPGTDFFASSLALGDLDGDGLPDLVPATAYPATSAADGTPFPGSWILRNTGYFAFAEETAARHGSFPDPGDSGQARFAALGDLDGSPGDELVLTMAYPSQAASPVFSANGKQYAYYFAAYYGNYVDAPTYAATRVLANDGTGVLSNATSSAVPSGGSTPFFGWGERWQAGAGALGDLDGDGDLDLCLSAPVAVVRGTLTGSSYYANGTTYLAEGYAYVAAARVLRNGGGGTFAAAAGAFPAPVYQSGTLVDSFEADAMALGDLDGDGDLDVVLSRSYPLGVYYQNPQNGYYYVTYRDATRVLANDGTGTFSFDPSRVPASYGSTHPYSMEYWQADALAVGDLDGDGDRDVVLGRSQSSYWYDTSTYGYRFEPAIRILANDGQGFFTEATASFLPAKSFLQGSPDTILSAESVVLGDLDGDGSQDLVVAGTVYAVYDYAGTGYGYYGILPAGPVLATKVFLNDGRGGLADETKRWLPAPVNGDRFHSNAAALGDLDGDGDLDLVLAADFYPDVAGTTAGHNRPIRVLETK